MRQMDGNISTIRCVSAGDLTDVKEGSLLVTTGWNTFQNAATVRASNVEGEDVSAVVFANTRWDDSGTSVSALEVKSTVIAPVLAGEAIPAGHYVMAGPAAMEGKAKSAGASLAAVAANMFVIGKALEAATADELFMCEMKAVLA